MEKDFSPKITNVRVRSVLVPLSESHKTANGVITESPLVLTDIETDTGVIGSSLIFTYTPAALLPTAKLIQNIAPLIIGNPIAPLEIEQKLTGKFRLLGTQGLTGMAIAAIDMALWDALARAQNTSLVRLLGGTEKPIKAYGGIGFDGPLGSAKAAEMWQKRGFQGVKAKIGYPTVNEDVDVVRAIRSAVNEDTAVMVDYNQCLSPSEALERIHILNHEGLTWIEEPTLAHDFHGQALVTQQSHTPIQCGENLWGALEINHAIRAGASNLIMPDVMKVGGVTGWMRSAALAQAHNIRVSSHLWPEISAQLLCCTPTAHWLEYIDWWNPILASPLEIENGKTKVPTKVGSGIDWEEKSVNQYLV